jgi:hypothetical protein
MPQTQVYCPQCRQPIAADIQQLFDAGESPQEKQVFLAGAFNIAQCPHCGYQGMISMPLVYHDPEKELLLTYFPPEIGLQIEEQQKTIGPIINRIVNRLPQEKRKGYLLNPKTMLTLQLMLEVILEADGITKEMLKAQEDRMELIQRLMTTPEESQVKMIQQEDEMIDQDFFRLLSRLIESVISGQDEESAKKLAGLQALLLEHTTKGKQLKNEAEEVQAAVQSLQEMGEEITREKLVELVSKAESDVSLRAYSRYARPGMDYSFFQMLSEKLERARGKGRTRLVEIREKLLAFTQEVDDEIQNRMEIAKKNVDSVMQAEDIKGVLEQNIGVIDEFFMQAVTQALDIARKEGDLDHSSRLQEILDVINELSAPPEEFKLIEDLLEISNDSEALYASIESHQDDISTEFMQMLNSILMQTHESVTKASAAEKDDQQKVLSKLQSVYDAVLAFSMRKKFN